MKKRLFSIALCAAVIAAAALGGADGLYGSAAEDSAEPVMYTFSKTGLGGADIQFTADDFLSRINDSYTLKGIVIAGLPDESSGTLKFGARDLMVGEAITADTLDSLRFVPKTSRVINTEFSFLPVFNEKTDLEKVTVNINLLGKENRPPVAEDFSVETCKNITAIKLFKAMDPDGDPLTYKITGKPKRGSVEIMDGGSFKYTPYENKTGRDSMTYVAIDSSGTESNEAKISIVIEKAPSRVAYSDMDGSAAHYAALKMAEKGLFIGEKIGDKYYFNPQSEMTRGEFLALMMTALGLHDGLDATRTGFADDADIPSWLKPYALSALKAGVITGVNTGDGRKAFYADRAMTLAEAAVLVNNACRMPNAGVAPVFSGGVEIPVWAAQAISNLSAADMPLYETGFDGAVTREQAIQMAYSALKYKEDKKGGLLSWAFS
ncbi:MAG: Ig-like domain-containing protein [Oscillospiraceae bacterium]|nr:Ig-like domain-containing protein [Oscillospiraceae bacterium]